MEVNGHLDFTANLPPGKIPRYALYMGLVGPQYWSVWMREESLNSSWNRSLVVDLLNDLYETFHISNIFPLSDSGELSSLFHWRNYYDTEYIKWPSGHSS
jgi:hypothetical protein